MGDVVMVSGASAGIGRACADRLAKAGWAVTGGSRRGTASPGWSGMVMDVDDQASVTEGMRRVITEHGRVDAVVACAGWGLAGAVEDTSIEEGKAQFETNLWGALRVVQAALPTMRSQRHGRIVLVSSVAGEIGIPFQAFYSASKFALEGLGEAMAYEVAPFGIHVTLVQPGNVRTQFTEHRRMAANFSSGNGPYSGALQWALRIMERDEANGAHPDKVAALIQKVLEARRPPRRVSVGKAGERLGLVAKRLLPHRAFEAAAKSSLGVN